MTRTRKGQLSEGVGLANLLRQAVLDEQLAAEPLRLFWVDGTDVVAARSREEALEVMRREYGTDECRDLIETAAKALADDQLDLPLVDATGRQLDSLRVRLAAVSKPTWLGGSQ